MVAAALPDDRGAAHWRNPRAMPAASFYPAPLSACLDAAGFAAAAEEIATWPGYAPTPLLRLDRLAAALGIGAIFYKDEAWRFGLDSFKALGGAYAICRHLAAAVASAGEDPATAASLAQGRHRSVTERLTVICASDGNHGRSVAWGARLFGCRCVIVLHADVSAGREAAIAAYGAEIRRVRGSYDDAVRHADALARAEGWTVVSDTSYPGYAAIPRDVMHGYGVLAGEAIAQMPDGRPPTHVFVQAGVGGLAASLCARFWQHYAAARPRFVVVEPERAACLFASARTGQPVTVGGALDTVMAGLSCGEVSALAWPVLDAGADDLLWIADGWAIDTVRLLAEGRHGDPPLVAGETGVAGLAGLRAALEADFPLGLDARSRVLVIGSEGATDPDIYRRLVGRSPEAVRAATPFRQTQQDQR